MDGEGKLFGMFEFDRKSSTTKGNTFNLTFIINLPTLLGNTCHFNNCPVGLDKKISGMFIKIFSVLECNQLCQQEDYCKSQCLLIFTLLGNITTIIGNFFIQVCHAFL